MSMNKRTCMRVVIGAVLIAALVWSGLFIRDKLTRSRVEGILNRLEEQKGPIDPAVRRDLRDLGGRATGALAERLKQGRFGDGALRKAFLAVGAPAVGALVESLGNEKPQVRLFAAEILGQVDGERKEIVRALVGALGDKAPDVRAMAAGSLGNLRIDAREAATALLECLNDSDASVRQAAVQAIGNVATAEPDVVEDLVKALADKDGQVRRAAVDALAAFGAPDEAIDPLVKLLGDDNEQPDVRWACVYAFRDIAPRGEAAIGALRKVLDSPDPHLTREAIGVLGKYETGRKETAPALIRALGNADGEVRAAAAKSLGNFGEEARAAAAGLLTCLQDKQWPVRKAAATALGKVAAPKSQAPAALVKALGDRDNHVREAAVLALMDLGMPDVAIGPIVKILDSDAEGTHIRWACAHALARTAKRGKPAIPALRKALKHADARLRKQAAEAIENIEQGVESP